MLRNIQAIRGNDHTLYMGVNSTLHLGYIQSIDVSTTKSPLIFNPVGGNVGIGNLDPKEKLHVNGGAIIDGKTYLNEKVYVKPGNKLVFGEGTANSPLLALMSQLNSTSNKYESFIDFRGDLYFRGFTDYTTINWEFPFAILGNGKVVMGGSDDVYTKLSSSPLSNYTLYVTRGIRTEELTIDLRGDWADYVFDSSYELRPLKEVATYISANKHLPDVPSTSEIKEDGLTVSEMLTIQMKKIEELTLYMIKLNEENEILKTKVDELSK